MRKETRNLIVFLSATMIWTWAFYAPIAIGHHPPQAMPWLPLYILGGMGPSLMGVALILLKGDREQRRDYWRRCFSLRRIGPLSWGVIVLIFPALLGVSIALDLALGGSLPGMTQLRGLLANPVMTGVYLNTSRSILSGMLLHFASNWTAQLIAPSSDTVEVVRSILVLAIGLIICVSAVRRTRAQERPAGDVASPA